MPTGGIATGGIAHLPEAKSGLRALSSVLSLEKQWGPGLPLAAPHSHRDRFYDLLCSLNAQVPAGDVLWELDEWGEPQLRLPGMSGFSGVWGTHSH